MKRILRKLITENCDVLKNSGQDLKTIYQVMFRLTDHVLGETDDGKSIRTVTYGQVKRQIETASAALFDRVGAAHEYIGLEMENCVEWIVAFWAILRSGNKPYLINRRHPQTLTEGALSHLKIRYIIGTQSTKLPGRFFDIAGLIADEDAEQRTCRTDFSEIFENEIALSTSATSLNEVVCFYSGKEISAQLLYTQGILKKSSRISKHYRGKLKLLAFLPFYHIFGLTAVYFWFTYFGRTLVFLKDYSAETILTTVRRHEVTHIFAAPILWHTVEKHLEKQLKAEGGNAEKKFYRGLKICTGLQNLFPYAGARLSVRIMRRVTDRLFGPSVLFCISGGSYLRDSALRLFNGIGYPLHNGYGMSEIGITSVELGKRPKDRNRNAIGQPFAGVEYRIGEDSALFVRAASTCRAVMVNGAYQEVEDWFETKDAAEYGENGRYFIRGRIGDTVIGENGENINPDVIEQSFRIPDAVNFSVLGLKKDGQAQERLSMVVAISPYLSAGRTEAMIADIYAQNDRLPTASCVRDFYATYDEIAPPEAIKVGRAYLLRALEQGRITLLSFHEIKRSLNAADRSALNPRIAKKVRTIVAQELGIEPETVEDDAHILAELGADSLQYFSMIQKMRKEFSLSGTGGAREEYKYTVREIVQYIEREF